MTTKQMPTSSVVPNGYAQWPLGPSQDAIAQERVVRITMSDDPDFERVVTLADRILENQYYDHMAEEDLERCLADMRFPG